MRVAELISVILFYLQTIGTSGTQKKGRQPWFNIIKPAGTATIAYYIEPCVSYAFAYITGKISPHWFTNGIMGLINCLCFAFISVFLLIL
ncbi:MAG TPA: hypothetical protein VLA03_07155 [Draconibacterium sp.]|nr:hypothetical protein [Draconibacterium sp.]